MPSSACDWSSDVCSSDRSEEHTSELQSRSDLVCRLLLEKKKKNNQATQLDDGAVRDATAAEDVGEHDPVVGIDQSRQPTPLENESVLLMWLRHPLPHCVV